MERDQVEIASSVAVCLGLLLSNPFVTNDIPQSVRQRFMNNFVSQLIVALGISYSITRSFRDSVVAVLLFLAIKHLLLAKKSLQHRSS